ncbi:hypothetical protein GCM10012287_02880 [Streptomyces daqingensis]|uniref:Uncharacterized protein n=1 Tax=Streptomyces daqingensis TaxID=1472640 RepID=A0ABQ2LRJ5_9ACTN|nr:hypothetical protein [Streptomyces daqingensis]GGO42310.1 hypothetical protein GCM10012287_02880 [Streptomyces daqingensis]
MTDRPSQALILARWKAATAKGLRGEARVKFAYKELAAAAWRASSK